MKKTLTALLAALALWLPMHAEGEWVDIVNGTLWQDTDGNTVQAHAPGFLYRDGVWYMCGEDRGRAFRPDVNLYSSRDLVHWTFLGKIIENGVTDPELGRRRMIERAKLLYSEKTGKYVVWCHWESHNYGASEAACFVADSVQGPYRKVWSGRPLGIKSRDCNVFTDDDGTAWFISTTEENQNLGLFRLHGLASQPVQDIPFRQPHLGLDAVGEHRRRRSLQDAGCRRAHDQWHEADHLSLCGRPLDGPRPA